MPKRTAHIDKLIVNSPFAEPAKFWSYDRESRLFTLEEGRRPAGYVVASPGAKGFDDPGVFVELPTVYQIRPRVKAWREAEYPGASGITKTAARALVRRRAARQRQAVILLRPGGYRNAGLAHRGVAGRAAGHRAARRRRTL